MRSLWLQAPQIISVESKPMRLRILSRPSSAALEAISARPSMRSWPSSSAASSSFTFAEIASIAISPRVAAPAAFSPVPSAHELRLALHCLPTRSKILRARLTLSDTSAVRRGEGRLISGSRAKRTAAMIAAAMTTVDFIRICSCICSAQASRSRAIARFISPISAPVISRVWGQVCTKACRERSRMGDSFSSLRRVGTARQSRYPASCPLGPGCFHRISCSGS